jgi:excisionase family DNA binding protein
MSLPNKDFFNVGEVADYFGYDPSTIRRWIEHGKLDIKTPGGSSIRIPRESIIKCENWQNEIKKRSY